jgi:lipooligosaccharide transport system permease protein
LTATAPTRSAAVASVLEGQVVWFVRNWKANLVFSVIQPLLALVAFGVFFGRLADDGEGLAEVTGGVRYIVYLTPALLCAAALQTASMEGSFPVFAGFHWHRRFQAITATPVSPGQLSAGYLTWVALRLLAGGAVYLAVAAAFGGVESPRIALALLVSVLTGLSFAAPLSALSASLKREGQAFNVVFRFVVVPMTLFAGTYFPIDRLPEWAQVVAVVTPLWHGTQLARDLTLGVADLPTSAGHLGYLLLWTIAGLVVSAWRFRVRLTP